MAEDEVTRKDELLTDLEALVDGPLAGRCGREPPSPGRPKRTRRPLFAVLLALLAAATAAWVWLRPLGGRMPVEIPGLNPAPSDAATLFFADPRWTKLVPEPRPLQPRPDAAARIRALFDALTEGPRSEAAAPILPRGAGLRAAYVGKNGLAVLDLEPLPEEADLGGASGELLAVFALVHTVTRNVPGIREVQLLVGGAARETLSGHLKISEPLRPEGQASEQGR